MRRHLLWVAVVSAPAWAQTAMESNQPMEHLLVTVPIHKSEAETALPVTVLSGDELRQRAAASIGQTLDGQPGLTSASFGPAVGQPVIRGQQGPRVRVLQNGTGSQDASRVSADHAVTVEPLLADRVEVLRGPSTLLYGGGAIGGVVNVIDNRIPRQTLEQPRGALELRHGSGSDEDTAVFRGEASGMGLNWHISGLYRDWGLVEIPGAATSEQAHAGHDHDDEPQRRGVIDNSDGRTHNVTLGTSKSGDWGYLGVAVSRLENEYGIPSGGHEHHGNDPDEPGAIRLDMEQTRIDLAGEYLPGGSIESLRGHITYNDYQHRELEGREVGTVYSNEAWEGRFELVHARLGGWHGVWGVQLSDSDFSAKGEESFIPRSQTRSAGLFGVEDYHWGDWIFELGGRLDRERVDPDHLEAERQEFTSVSGSASALWDVTEHWALGAALSRSERAPTVEELFSNHGNTGDARVAHAASQAVEVGDADLDTEVSRNLDLSVRWHQSGWEAHLTAFYNDFSDFIYLANSGEELDELPVLVYRQQDARFHGLEYELGLPAWHVAGVGTLQMSLYGDVIRGRLNRDGDVPRLPPRRIGFRTDWALNGWSAYVDVLKASAQRRSGELETDTDGYTRVDAGVQYALRVAETDATLFLRGRNLGDREIRNATSFLRNFAPEPGRTIEAGVRWVF